MTDVQKAEPVKLKEILEKTTQFFKQKDFDSPRLDAELLLAKALNLRRIDLYLKYDQPLAETELQQCRELVRRRSKGEPVAYILEQKDFYGFSFYVDKNVLIPRPETELLVEAVLERASKQEPLSILDLGCGSGCIGLSLLKKLENAELQLLDISSAALEVAKKNAGALQLSERCQFTCGDASEMHFSGQQFDVIVSNPPYISSDDERVQKEVVEFEPHQALFATQNGLGANFSWSKQIITQLKPGGIMAFEFGIDQSPHVRKHFEDLGVFSEIKIIKDFSGIDRHILALRKDS